MTESPSQSLSGTSVLASNVAVPSFPCPVQVSPPTVTVTSTTETMLQQILEEVRLIREMKENEYEEVDAKPANRYL